MSKLEPKLKRCPTCGRGRMLRRRRDVVVDEGRHVVRGVEVDVCDSCGEELFDPPAMRKIEDAFPPRSPRSRRASG